jgi:hypothetical protein
VTKPSSTLRREYVPPPVERIGDPDDPVDAREFARIMGWGSYRAVFTASARARFNALRDRVQPLAAALVGQPDPAPAPPNRDVQRSVGERLEALGAASGADGSRLMAALADDLALPREQVHAALVALARPPRRSPWTAKEWADGGRRVIPRPDAGEYRWRRSTVWEYADGRRGPAPASRPARFSAEQVHGAEQAVRDAVDTGVCLDAEELGRRLEVTPAASENDPLEPARSLLLHALGALRVSGEVDLRTRAEICADTGLTVNQLVALLRKPGAPEPVVRAARLTYYRGGDVDGALADAG